MPFSPAGVFQELFSAFRGQKRAPARRAARRRNSLGQTMGGERLEVRSLLSANPIVAHPVAVSGYENQALNNVPVATFTAGNGSEPASDFKAVVVWGDGASTTGNVAESGGTYVVTGSHTFTDINNNPVVVGIVDVTDPSNTGVVVDSGNIAPLLPNGTQGTPDQRYVYEYLKDVLQRPISMADVNYWTAQFEKNHEDRQTFSSIVIESTPPYEYRRDEIASSYETYLHRAPDAAGENFYLQLVNNSQGAREGQGVDFGTEKRTSALLISSPEFYQDAGSTVNGFITAVFEDALKRAPSAADLAYYSYQLTHGMTHIEFATTVLNSPESLTRTIDSLYERYLGRAPDPTGLQNFINNYNAGYGTETNTETILDTDEFYNRAVGLPLNTVD